MPEKLFAYGTLKQTKIQKESIGRLIKNIPDTLLGFKKIKLKINNKTYPAVVKDSTSTQEIKGAVLEINKADLKKIDAYETKAYQRKKEILKSGLSVWVYQK